MKNSNEVLVVRPAPNSGTLGNVAVEAPPVASAPTGVAPGPLLMPGREKTPSVAKALKPRFSVNERETSANRTCRHTCWPPEISRKFSTMAP